MAFPTSEERIAAEEKRLGRRLPEDLRARLLRQNGGEIETDERYTDSVEDPRWELIGVADVIERKGRPRPVGGMVDATEAERETWGELWDLPEDVAVIGDNGSGDLLLLMPDNSTAFWDHEFQEAHPVGVRWG